MTRSQWSYEIRLARRFLTQLALFWKPAYRRARRSRGPRLSIRNRNEDSDSKASPTGDMYLRLSFTRTAFLGRQTDFPRSTRTSRANCVTLSICSNPRSIWPDDAGDLPSGGLWWRCTPDEGVRGSMGPADIEDIQVLQAGAGIEQDYRVFGLQES